ncbi:MAG TPA: nucleoside hydrolase, partial [Tepidisphaeraceae bacterium]|nr:nucleoside hydrolase [Tepidisphaeraceae bacterium]
MAVMKHERSMVHWVVWGMLWGICWFAGTARGAEPLKVIFDTDMDGDNDDVAAAAILHALADEGRVEILAMGVVSRCAYSPACLDAINTYYRRGEIPIGVYKGSALAEVSSPYAKVVAERCPNDIGLAEKVPDVLKVYRRALAGEADGAVTMIAVGQMNNLVDLLSSRADEVSPLAGRELVARKVTALFVMGPYFSEENEFHRAYNFTTSPKAAIELVNNWPTKIKFGEGILGHRHFIESRLKETLAENPVRIAFEAYFAAEKRNTGKSENKRHCADPATVMYAVFGKEYFGEVGPGACEVREDGFTRWNASRDRQQFYNTQKVEVGKLEEVMEKLLVRMPRPKYQIQTLVGNGMAGDVPSGGGKAKEICVDLPFGVENGPDGGLFITTVGSHRVLRLDRESGEIRSVVGNGRKGNSGDGGPANEASLNEPYEVRFDS